MVRVVQSTIIDAPISEVWSILRDFNGHDRWHPAIASSEIENGEPADAVGAVRQFRLTDGGLLREQLLSLSDKECSFTYCLLESPLPLMGYVAKVRLRPVTDTANTFWEWCSEFNPPPWRRDELVKLVAEEIYQEGFRAIRSLLRRNPVQPRPVGGESVRTTPSVQHARPATPARTSPDQATAAKAIVVDRYGGPEVMQFKDVWVNPPAAEEVQIRHTVIGVNFIDVYCRTGYFDLLTPPDIPGMEAAGVVVRVGAEVQGFSPGDRVAYACPPVGSYSELRNMSPELLVRLSDDISDETAAAGLLKGITASFLLHDVHHVQPGTVAVIHAAAGGVGQFLVQWARHLGATVIAVVSTDDKARLVERLGAHHVIVYSRENFADAVMRLTNGKGADVAYDAVGNDTFGGSLAALAVRGHLVSFGQASGPVGNWDIGRFSSKSITISRPNYAHFTDSEEKLAPHVNRFFSALRQGVIKIEPPTRYPLSRAADAHRDLETRRTTGALVLTA